jgi:hypothetical protein
MFMRLISDIGQLQWFANPRRAVRQCPGENHLTVSAGEGKNFRIETVKKVRLVKAANGIGSPQLNRRKRARATDAGLVDGYHGQTMEHFG